MKSFYISLVLIQYSLYTIWTVNVEHTVCTKHMVTHSSHFWVSTIIGTNKLIHFCLVTKDDIVCQWIVNTSPCCFLPTQSKISIYWQCNCTLCLIKYSAYIFANKLNLFYLYLRTCRAFLKVICVTVIIDNSLELSHVFF